MEDQEGACLARWFVAAYVTVTLRANRIQWWRSRILGRVRKRANGVDSEQVQGTKPAAP